VIRIGVVLPIVTLMPGAHGKWERTAGLEGITAVAQAADRLGYHHVTCSEHTAVPSDVVPTRGGTYWDPLATLSYLAAKTERIGLTTNVLVLGYHHPLEIAKRYGTLDLISGGRLILGVGVGSLTEEFELLGVPFDDRGPRADDELRALRASFGQAVPAYEGPYYSFRGMVVDPCGPRTDVPFWVGGRTLRSLRRAVDLADGWIPFGLDPPALASMLGRVEVPAGFQTVLSPPRALDPSGSPTHASELLGAVVQAGATIASVRLVGQSLAHYIEQLEALAALP
jgi:probable F420-dependent oxidoreductase